MNVQSRWQRETSNIERRMRKVRIIKDERWRRDVEGMNIQHRMKIMMRERLSLFRHFRHFSAL